jgi:intracellular septation protein
MKLDTEGWRKLTLRWACFFVFLAIVNEIVWRNTSTDTWVSFKVFGILPLTIAFTITQIPLIQRHEARDEEDAASPSSSPSPEESAD